MPFVEKMARSFLVSTIREFAPALSGVYGITNAGEWIYIGESDNIRDSLFRHLEESGTNLINLHPTGFVFEVCAKADRNGRQDRLIREYEPTCNRHWSRHA